MRKLAKSWLEFAARDLAAAKNLLNISDLSCMVAFHCQQTIEKAFKAILELRDLPIPRIHDLVTLFLELAEEIYARVCDLVGVEADKKGWKP